MKLSRLKSDSLVTLTFEARGNGAKEVVRVWKLVRRQLTRRQR